MRLRPHNAFKSSFFFTSILILLVAGACKKDDPAPPLENEEELITTLTLVLTDPVNQLTRFSFRDTDGNGGQDPLIEDIVLAPNTSYAAQLEVLNEAESPAENIALEIRAEASDHLFIYQPTGGLNLNINITDEDESGDPVGLESRFQTGAASAGSLRIILKHEADKDNALATGETDIDVTFPVKIE